MRSSAGSISGECAASETYSRCPTTLRFANSVSTVSTAAASPEMTALCGPLTAATARRSLSGGDRQLNVLERGEQRRHRAVARMLLHQPPAARDQPQPVLERENSGRAGGGVFPHGMADDRGRGRRPRTSTASSSAYSNANMAGCVQPISWMTGLASASGPEHRIQGTALPVRPQEPVAMVDRVAERRRGVVEGAAHAGILGARAGIEESDVRAPARTDRPAPHPRVAVASARGLQSARRLVPVRGHDRQTVREMGASHARDRMRRRRAAAPSRARAPLRSGARARAARFRCAPKSQDSAAAGRRPLPESPRRGASSRMTWAFVPLKPNELTPADAASRRRSRAALVDDRDRQIGPVDVTGSARWKCRCGGNRAVLQRQHHLDEAGDARRGFQMADIGLDRTDQQRTVVRSRPAPNTAAKRAAPRSDRRARFPVPCAST